MEKVKKPIYKKWWFWVLIVVFLIIVIGASNGNSNNTISTSSKMENKPEVIVVNFEEMSKELINDWFKTNNIKGKILEEYSDTIPKGNIISQSANPNDIIHQGDKVTVTYSLGKEPTKEEKNALKKAESYSKIMHMSKKGIYNQLISKYGENFTAEAAQYAIDNIEADWKENALEKAKSYQSTMNMSKQKIYSQLISEYGEKFTKEEAQYAIDHLED